MADELGAAAIPTPRRYYLLKRLYYRGIKERILEGVWRSKQEGQPGTPLPLTFVHLTKLATAGYTMKEDLQGATELELQEQGFTNRDAKAILAAAAAL